MDRVVSRLPDARNRGGADHVNGAIARSRFWEQLRDVALNDRQRMVINRLLDGFEAS